MADLTLWKQKELKQLRDEMDQMVMDFFRDFGAPVFDDVRGDMILADISEEGDSLVISAKLEGVEPEDLEIAVSPDALVISGKKKATHNTPQGRLERSSSFSSRIKLPCRIEPDQVEASFENHTLQIILPKCTSKSFRKVSVSSSSKQLK